MYVAYDPKTVSQLKTTVKAVENDNKPMGEDPFFYSEEAKERNFGFTEVKILEGNIGYIKLTQINFSEKSLPVLFSAMQFVANTKALIVDLQENGGGGNAIGNVFESYFLPKNTVLLEIKSIWETVKPKQWLG